MSAVAIRPEQVTTANLTSTNATESTPAWNSGTIYVAGDQRRSDTTHRIYESAIGEAKGAVTISIASPGVVTLAGHNLAANTRVAFTTTGALPTGLAANTVYYVRNPAANTFELSATSGGASINTSGGQSGTHSLYAEPNLAFDPTDPDNAEQWLDAGPTNDFAMFDSINGTATVRADGIEVVIEPTQIDSIGMDGIAGGTVRVRLNNGLTDLYDQTFNMISSDGIVDWYSWFFEERRQEDSLLLTDLPQIEAPIVTVTIDATGGIARCGTLAIGRQLDIGKVATGVTLGFHDYSIVEADEFGVYSVTQRGYSRRTEAKLLIPNSRIRHIQRELFPYRATPLFWGLSSKQSATNLSGFFKRLDIEIAYHSHSLVNLQIEGTTE